MFNQRLLNTNHDPNYLTFFEAKNITFEKKRNRFNLWKITGLVLLFFTGGLFVFNRKIIKTPEIAADTGYTLQNYSLITDMEEELKSGITNICTMPKVNFLCKNDISIQRKPRKDMPQLSHHVIKKYLAYKQRKGIIVEKRIVPAEQLIPTQNEINAENVLDMYYDYQKGTFNPCNQLILIAIDHHRKYIIDGHHRTMACLLTEGNQNVVAIHDSVENILHDLKYFKGVTYDTSIFKPPIPDKRDQEQNNRWKKLRGSF